MKTKRKTTPRDDEEPSPTRHLVNYERNYYKERYLQVKLDQAESESLKHRDSAERLAGVIRNILADRVGCRMDAREALAQWEGDKQ